MGEIDLYADQKKKEQIANRKFIRVFTIDQQPWDNYYKADVSSKVELSYDKHFLYLKFISIEPKIEAKYRGYNGNVHEDSCVEFFVRFDDDMSYYNLEVNMMGNIKMAYGKDRFSRTFLSIDTLKQIERSVLIEPIVQDDKLYLEWNIDLKIPTGIFTYNNVLCLENHKIFGNFYKCGGGLKQPDYLCWNHIMSDEPDFHRPEFFKLIHESKEI